MAWTPKNCAWSLGVTLWEIAAGVAFVNGSSGSSGKEPSQQQQQQLPRPFDSVSDAAFVRAAIDQPLTLAAAIGKTELTVRTCLFLLCRLSHNLIKLQCRLSHTKMSN